MQPEAVDRPLLLLATWSGGERDAEHVGVDPVPERTPLGHGPAGDDQVADGQPGAHPEAEERQERLEHRLGVGVDCA